MKKLWIPALAALAVAALTMPAVASAQVTFPDGVASGDVTQSRAILWTRCGAHPAGAGQGRLVDELVPERPEGIQGQVQDERRPRLDGEDRRRGLQPGTQYWYRFSKDADNSDVGTFRTAPDAPTWSSRGA